MEKIIIRGRSIGENCPMLVIAEVACAHEGDFDKLIRLIDIAIATNAGAVKFQILNAEAHITASHQIYDLVKTLEFSKEQWLEAITYLRNKSDILIMTDIYDEASIDIVKAVNPDMIKIHSADLNNYRLLRSAASLQKPTLIGVGASTIDEIRDGLAAYKDNFNGFIGLLHGYQAFPTHTEELQIIQINTLKQYFNVPVGFLDHTEGDSDESIFIPLVARGAGAFAIEKHITIDREHKGIDYESALSLPNFHKMTLWLKEADKAMGNRILQPLSQSEKRYRSFMKKNIVAARDLKKGDILTDDSISFKRSENGVTGDHYYEFLNRILTIDVKKDQNILFTDLKL
jgi:sialic acid synthase SpsE